MLHTGTHAFDMLRLWCGEFETVQAWLVSDSGAVEQSGYRFDTESRVADLGGFAVLTTADGVRATIHAANKNYFRFEFELVGSDGIIRVGNSQRELWCRAASPRFSGFQELQRVPFPDVPNANTWSRAADNLVAAVEGRARPACDVTDGLRALAIGLAMHVSQREGNRPVQLDEVPDDLRIVSR
jgi:predicted dehydrogenase